MSADPPNIAQKRDFFHCDMRNDWRGGSPCGKDGWVYTFIVQTE